MNNGYGEWQPVNGVWHTLAEQSEEGFKCLYLLRTCPVSGNGCVLAKVTATINTAGECEI